MAMFMFREEKASFLLLCVCLVLILCANPLSAAERYVDSAKGNDRGFGTLADPWRTISKVMKSARSGDSVYFKRGGRWKEQLDIPASNMTFDAYGEGVLPVIDGNGENIFCIFGFGVNNISIQNLEITNPKQRGIQIRNTDHTPGPAKIAHHIQIRNCYFHDIPLGAAIWLYAGTSTQKGRENLDNGEEMYDVAVQDNRFVDIGESAILLCGVKNVGTNIISGNHIIRSGIQNVGNNAISLHALDGVVVEKNYVTDTRSSSNGSDGHGINLDWIGPSDKSLCRNCIIRYNYIENGLRSNEYQSGVQVYHGKNNHIYGNISVNNKIGYRMTTSDATGNVFYNNVAYKNQHAGIEMESSSAPAMFINNIFYGSHSGDIAIHVAYASKAPIERYNLFYNFSSAGITLHPTDLTSDPLFRNPVKEDFALQKGSPCINAGANLGKAYGMAILPGATWPHNIQLGDQDDYGQGWEIGAYIESSL